MWVENNKLYVYFRIPFFKYFIVKEKGMNVFSLAYRIFHSETGLYRWKIL
jgi:hypothetical protein